MLLEISARGGRSLPAFGKGRVFKGNLVQSCRDSRGGSATAVVDTPKAVRVGKGMELAAALPVAAQEPSCHPTKIWVVLRKAVSKRKIICEDVLEYWLTALFQTTDKKKPKNQHTTNK